MDTSMGLAVAIKVPPSPQVSKGCTLSANDWWQGTSLPRDETHRNIPELALALEAELARATKRREKTN